MSKWYKLTIETPFHKYYKIDVDRKYKKYKTYLINAACAMSIASL